MRSELAPVAGLLEAAEGRRHAHRAVGVDRQHARLQRRARRAGRGRRRASRSSPRGRRSCRSPARSPAARRGTGSRPRSARTPPRARPALAGRPGRARSGRTRSPAPRARVPRNATRSPSSRNEDDRLALAGGDQRAHLRVLVQRVADAHRLHGARSSAAMKRLHRLLLHEDPRARAAVLPGVAEHRPRRRRGGGLEVGVGEHDVGRLAAQLERHALDRARPRPARSSGPPRSSR